MLYLTDDDVARLVSPADALDAVTSAFAAFGRGDAAVQRRERTDAGGVKLSTLGAVLPSAGGEGGVLGAKVYSTVGGAFTFLVVLFAAADGRRLAVLDSGALTRLRTAATSVLSTRVLRTRSAPVERVVVFGSGSQGRGHVDAFSAAYPDADVVTVGRSTDGGDVEKAVGAADVVVTATRATTPVLLGAWLPDGVHVCAVGTSRPDACELDAGAYARADVVTVEWLPQARHEAGGLVQAVDAGVLTWDDVVELAPLVAFGEFGAPETTELAESGSGVTVFQSVGIGLEDVAVAEVAWRLAVETGAGIRLGNDPQR